MVNKIQWVGAWLCLAALNLCAEPFADLSFDAAAQEAAHTGKILLVDFYTTWCVPCRRMDKQTWTDAAVIKLLQQKTVALRIDAEKQGDPLAPIFGDIPQHPPNRVGVLEIMLGDQLLIKGLPLEILEEANRDCLQEQRLRRSSSNRTIEHVHRHASQFSKAKSGAPEKYLNPSPFKLLPRSLSAALPLYVQATNKTAVANSPST